LFAAVQVTQASLPFGQQPMVIDPMTGRYAAGYKQIMRVRLLLHPAESTQVRSRQAGLQTILRGFALRR
jgi:hypothetical protein